MPCSSLAGNQFPGILLQIRQLISRGRMMVEGSQTLFNHVLDP